MCIFSKERKVNVETNQPSTNSIEKFPTTITDVNNDCLERIFEKISVWDLLNIVESNSWLNEAACSVFKRKYGNKKVKLQDVRINRIEKIYETEDEIVIKDLRICLRFLRFFGHSISKLEISYFLMEKKYCDYVDQYIEKYCIESLNEIVISSNQNRSLDWLKKTLPKVKKLNFIDCELDKELTEFNKWFPGLCSLELEGSTKCSSDGSIEEHFPYLEHLTTKLNPSIVGVIQLNPQLQSLHIKWADNYRMLKEINGNLQQLKRLQIDCTHEHLKELKIGKFHFEQVNAFKMYYNGMVDNTSRIPFKFAKLEEFTFESQWNHEMFFKFIKKNPSIRKLNLGLLYANYRELNNDEKAKLLDALPSLTEIKMPKYTFTGRHALSFVQSFKSLRSFNFKIKYSNSFDGLLERLPGWKGSINKKRIVNLERIGH